MKQFFTFILLLFTLYSFGQEQQLANQYFRNGEYEKAASLYEALHQKHPYNTNYLNYLIDCYQQLDEFGKTQLLIENQLRKYPQHIYLNVELGYNYQLQEKVEEAENYYEKALATINAKNNSGYTIGRSFQENHLFKYALKAYRKAMELNPAANYNFQMAFIYGEQGDISKMFDTYLNMVAQNPNYLSSAKTYIGKFITDDSESSYNISLKNLLLKRLQNNPNNTWNHLLSWLFLQQKDYFKALIQEKALHKRNLSGLQGIIEIGRIAFENNDFESAKDSFNYVLENNPQLENELLAQLYLLEIDLKTNVDFKLVNQQFLAIFNQYGKGVETVGVQLIYAEFLAFKINDTESAIQVLKDALKLPLNEFQKGRLKIVLADVFVLQNKYSTALIYYTQVQKKLKNHPVAQSARFKIAQTSYFKGDFEWAQTQLKVLKKSTSQLIANDALDLNLLITDNAVKDSLKIALKTYAKADLLAFQQKNIAAIDTLNTLLKTYKGHPIEDEALFKQATLFELTNQFLKAEQNYLKIIELSNDDILVDDAHYFLAELYVNKLNQVEKAKEYYQKIIFDYPSSIYLVEARKKFRKLRGDIVN
jgi:tetratricopeptide (TPR) repeat protein